MLLGRKAKTNLKSILKSRDITLPTKIHIVKAMVFPVVMYICERQTIKKVEHWRIDAFKLWWWGKLLRVPWTARRSNQSILKEINPEYSLKACSEKEKSRMSFSFFVSWEEYKENSKQAWGEGNGTPLQYSCLENPMDGGAWWAADHGVAKSRTRLSDFTFTFPFHALEKEMAAHSSTLAWRIPGTGEPGGLPSLGSHRVGHDWSDLAAAAAEQAWTLLIFFYFNAS